MAAKRRKAHGIKPLKVAVADFAKLIDVNLGAVMRKITIDLHGKITKRTPVDTGRARASWAVSINAPPSGPPPPPGSYPTPPMVDAGKITGKTRVYIVSRLVYIEPLENGHSKQAPRGMLRIALAEIAAEIDTIVAEITGNAP